jgi:ParB/RepB/Spo0J family partition protein
MTNAAMKVRKNKQSPKPSRNGTHTPPAKGSGVGKSEPLEQRLARIPLAQIIRSNTNPREEFDPEELARLADSIRSKGVIQPISVRPHPKKRGFYELVAGERRWRASKLAGCDKINAVVADHSDDDVCEIQVIENDQRVDVSPIERGRGYQRLIDRGRTVSEIAVKTGRSPSTIRVYLRLGRMPVILAQALRDEVIPLRVAQLVCHIPNAKLREKAALCILKGARHPDDVRANDEDNPLSGNEARLLVEEFFMVELKGSPFDVLDAKLLPAAGSCEACPKRTGNDRDAFPQGRADVCTDPECYRDKCRVQRRVTEAEAKRIGLNVLTAAETKPFFAHGGYFSVPHDFIDLDSTCYETPTHRPWRNAIGAALEGMQQTLVYDDDDKPHYLVNRTAAMKIVEKEKPGAKPSANGKPVAAAVAGRHSIMPFEIEDRTREHAGRHLATLAGDAKSALGSVNSALTTGGKFVRGALEALAAAAIAESEDDVEERGSTAALAKGRVSLMNIFQDDGVQSSGPMSANVKGLLQWSTRASAEELLGFLLERASHRWLELDDEVTKRLVKLGKIDTDKLGKQAQKELEAELKSAGG